MSSNSHRVSLCVRNSVVVPRRVCMDDDDDGSSLLGRAFRRRRYPRHYSTAHDYSDTRFRIGGFFAKSRTHSLFCNNSADTAPSKYVVRRRRVVGGGDSRNPTKITIYLTIHPKANIFTYATGTIHQHTPTMAVAKDTDFQWGKGMIHGTKFPPPSRKTTIIAYRLRHGSSWLSWLN